MANGDAPVLTVKEAVMEVRQDVKDLLEAMAQKADRAEMMALVLRVEVLERKSEAKDAVETYRKWIVGLGATVILTLLVVLANFVMRIVSGVR